ncbi:MAG: 2,3-bisphosphoglycerate-independent phosphoglycerate mutase [Flavobacteriales bacterium]
MKKAALIILDGWGIGDKSYSDGIHLANTPNFDGYLSRFPHCTLKTFGEYVGLPEGQMGNSEVGHLNIGAGRIVYQDLARINNAVERGELAENKVLQKAIKVAEEKGVALHLMGLVSHGGVHSSQHHLHALIDILEGSSVDRVYVHAFTDGRDTEPRSAIDNIRQLETRLNGKKARLVSMIGRYYAMDRDKRWERIKAAYDLLVNGIGNQTNDFVASCNEEYQKGVSDEFFNAHIITGMEGRIKEDDVVLCFNFRTDRCRQITTALTQQSMREFNMEPLRLHYVTMTRYDENFRNVHVMFEKENLVNTLGEVISNQGGTQLRIAETEKYPHVTFFFSGGREEAFKGEDRSMAHSPKVATYDLQPEMSARQVADSCIEVMESTNPDFVCLNFANPDMVGHTGVPEAILKAVETVDSLLGEVVDVAIAQGYSIVIIADHGNADQMFQSDGTPHTAHTTNLVPCILISKRRTAQISDGILADVAPTILDLMELTQPADMSGRSLIQQKRP